MYSFIIHFFQAPSNVANISKLPIGECSIILVLVNYQMGTTDASTHSTGQVKTSLGFCFLSYKNKSLE